MANGNNNSQLAAVQNNERVIYEPGYAATALRFQKKNTAESQIRKEPTKRYLILCAIKEAGIGVGRGNITNESYYYVPAMQKLLLCAISGAARL